MNLAKGTFEFGWLTTLDVVSLPALVILLPFSWGFGGNSQSGSWVQILPSTRDRGL